LNDERASVEGMPLYMLIMVVIVVVSIGILMGILGGFQGQNIGDVTVDPDSHELPGGGGEVAFNVTVKDTDGKGIEGATVYISGEGVSTASKTGDDGRATFIIDTDLGNKAVGELSIKVTHEGLFGEQTRTTSVLLVAS
jgi:hypothetical protein